MTTVTLLEALGIGGGFGLVVAVVVVGMLRSFAGGYLSEKAKNLASKEDIATLTELVEDVRYKFATDLEDHRTKNQLRMAALDRRLQAHQEAFKLWRKLFFNVHADDVRKIVSECQEWWESNCIYLEPEAREAFSQAYFNAGHHAAYLRMGNISLITENFDAIRNAGQTILKAAQLPGLTVKEKEQVESVMATPEKANS